MKFSCLLLPLLLVPVVLRGDVIAVFDVKDGQQFSIAYRDDNHVRVNFAEDSYFLINQGKPYLAHREGGRWSVQDLEALRKQLEAMGMGRGMAGMDEPRSFDEPEGDIRDTGRTERIAGITGSVFEMVSGEGDVQEVVLTDHEGVSAVYQVFMKSLQSMAFTGSGASQQLMDPMPMGVPLRVGDEFALSSYTEVPLGQEYFALPSQPEEPMSRPGREEGMGDRILERSRDTTTREVEREADDRIQRGVRRIFGR